MVLRQAFCAAIVSAASWSATPVRFEQSAFTGAESTWTRWAPRDEIAPRTFIDAVHDRGSDGSLAISGNSNPAAYGGWQRSVGGIQPGHWYRLSAWYRADGSDLERQQILARLDWMKSARGRAGQPDFAWKVNREGEWRHVILDAQAPKDAASVNVQLFLANAPHTTVWWDDVSLTEVPAPQPRHVTVAAVNLKPQRTASAAESVERFVDAIKSSLTQKADIILLPEGVTVVGNGKKYAEIAETIPGPTTSRLGEVARDRNAWVVAGIYEREGTTIYNTSVLLDRSGRVAGKYRKVYLPREEYEGGLTPGQDYPVFQTDFGKIGMMICWDVQYADPARALAMRGAELILMPIWGGNQTLGKARAIENHVFLASSGYNYPTQIVDPDGELLSVAQEQKGIAIATIDLERRYHDAWLGDMRGRFFKELRSDVTVVPER
jgi:predicted amidohydrolase